jgi:cobalt-zinc-cadmium resistance protein CzcA
MAPITTPLGEMFMFTVESPAMSLEQRRSLLDWVIRPALRSVPGVADVNALGGKVRSLRGGARRPAAGGGWASSSAELKARHRGQQPQRRRRPPGRRR